MSCDVTFRISAQTSIGENVYVVGDHERIGSWNLERALLAHTSGETYPIWSAQASFLAEKTVQFKYVKRNGAGAAVWESMQQNRTVSLQPNTVITLNSEFNNSEVQETVETKSVEVKTLEDEVKGVTKHNNMLESTATPVSSLSEPTPIVMNGGGGGGGTAGDHPVVTTMMNGSGKHMTADDHENSGKAVNGKGNHSTEKMGKKNRKVLKAVGAVLSSLSRSVMCYGPGTSSLRERRKANALKKANGKSVVVVANGV